MVLWNKYIKSHVFVSDNSLRHRCIDFIHAHYELLAEANLRETLILHFCNLWDEGLVSSTDILCFIKIFDTYNLLPGNGKM